MVCTIKIWPYVSEGEDEIKVTFKRLISQSELELLKEARKDFSNLVSACAMVET